MLLVWIVVQSLPLTVQGFCQIGDCDTFPQAHPNCSSSDVTGEVRYVPVNQPGPVWPKRSHLFNWLQDPTEVDCVELVLWNIVNRSNDLSLQLSLRCRSQEREFVCFDYGVQFENGSLRCLDRWRSIIRSACKVFIRERLRLSYLNGGQNLLLEDLSGLVPIGSWIMLRRGEWRTNLDCKCEKFTTLSDVMDECFKRQMSNNKTEIESTFYKKELGIALGITISSLTILLTSLILYHCSMIRLHKVGHNNAWVHIRTLNNIWPFRL